MTPPYAELVAAVRREGAGIAAAGDRDVSCPVPTCGDWMMSDLLVHVGRVYRRAATIVSERATERVDMPPEPDGSVDAVAYFTDALDEIVDALASTEPDTPMWNWAEQPEVAAFWARRMAHESTVHRYDAQRALDVAQPIDADLAADGMDEFVDIIVPRMVEFEKPSLPSATYLFSATDDGTWVLEFGDGSVTRLEGTKSPDVTVRGTASAVLLAAYNRVPWTSLECEGDASLLTAWSQSFRF